MNNIIIDDIINGFNIKVDYLSAYIMTYLIFALFNAKIIAVFLENKKTFIQLFLHNFLHDHILG